MDGTLEEGVQDSGSQGSCLGVSDLESESQWRKRRNNEGKPKWASWVSQVEGCSLPEQVSLQAWGPLVRMGT